MFVEQKEVGEVAQQVGKLKLSEAIRIGARLRPQCTGRLFSDGKSCALGAAYETAFGYPQGELLSWGFSDVPNDMHDFFPFLYMKNSRLLSNLGREIHARNDSGESRESIADWLEAQGY